MEDLEWQVTTQSFTALPRSMRDGLNALSSWVTFGRGSILFSEGETPRGVFVLEQGRVKLSASAPDGRSLLVRRGESGEMLGLPAAVSGRRHEVTAEAMERIDCRFISREAFLEFLQENGDAAVYVARILTDFYQTVLHQVRYLGLSTSTAEKLARFLLDLSHGESEGSIRATTLPLTHKEIADMIGSSRETVTRMLARFKREQLIDTDASGLRISNRAGLEQMLAGEF